MNEQRRNDGLVVVNKGRKKERKKRSDVSNDQREGKEKKTLSPPPHLPRPHLISAYEYKNERMAIHDMERGEASDDRWATALHFSGVSWREGRKEGMKGFYFNRVTLHPATLLKHIANAHNKEFIQLCANNGAMVSVPRKGYDSPTHIFIRTLRPVCILFYSSLSSRTLHSHPRLFEVVRHKTALCEDVHTFIHSYAVVS
ncbi:MAG: hypothetical protein BYD32DRAFT_204564 [Podila humilis]|nr:MAG: hypothetical protein BYD32DRAFT_204564 [Podila humilis]